MQSNHWHLQVVQAQEEGDGLYQRIVSGSESGCVDRHRKPGQHGLDKGVDVFGLWTDDPTVLVWHHHGVGQLCLPSVSIPR